MSMKSRKSPPPPPMRKGHSQTFEALQTYQSQKEGDLSFEEGDILFVIEKRNSEEWYAILDGKEGMIPSGYVSCENTRAISVEAARRGNIELLNACLTYGVSVNALDASGSTALHAASKSGHLSCVRRLLEEKGVSIDIQNNLGDTPLHCASYRGHADIVEILIQARARTDIVNRENQTAKYLAKENSVALKFNDQKRRSSNFSFDDYAAQNDGDSD